nr:glycosyltransferase family 2 protein [Segniliparus rotundus]
MSPPLSPERPFGTERVWAVIVTHRRASTLRRSLAALQAQTAPLAGLVVVDNAAEQEVAELVAELWPTARYIGSKRNLGGAGGFALGILTVLAEGADWVWLADDDGRPESPETLGALLSCARRHGLAEVSPAVVDEADPDRLAFPLRRGLRWRRRRSELGDEELLPGIASLFNGALFRTDALFAVGVPDLRLFLRGDEVEVHRRLVQSGLRFGTCLHAAYLHPQGSDEFLPILGGAMHAQYPSDEVKRFYTYRNRGYLQAQRGMRKLVAQEWARFGWFFLVTRRDLGGFREWARLRRIGRQERFGDREPQRHQRASPAAPVD